MCGAADGGGGRGRGSATATADMRRRRFGWASKHSYVSLRFVFGPVFCCCFILILYLLCNDPWQLNCFSFGFLATNVRSALYFVVCTFCASNFSVFLLFSFQFSLRYAALQMLDCCLSKTVETEREPPLPLCHKYSVLGTQPTLSLWGDA